MPEFIMPFGDVEAVRSFNSLDTFTQAYVEAMFFTDCHCDNEELEDATFDDLSAEALQSIIADCEAFQRDYAALLDLASERSGGYGLEQAGHDYWLTRNRHGAGFWDRGLGAVGSDLTRAAHSDGEVVLYRGDDGSLYLM